MDGTRIADLADLPTDDTFLFRVRAVDGEGTVASGEAALHSDERAGGNADGGTDSIDGGADSTDDGVAMPDDMRTDDDVREAILLRLATEDGEPADDVACWLNYCQHMTHIKLDKGSGAPVRDGEVICANHGALFEADSGVCTYGPCEGAVLNELGVAVADGGVYLDDEAYTFVGEGPVETDDDLSSSSNVVL